MSLDTPVQMCFNFLMKEKKIRSADNRKKEILNLLDSMDPGKLGLVHGIILTALFVGEATENKAMNNDKDFSFKG